jgi:branched-chain amino acid transport system permease protein
MNGKLKLKHMVSGLVFLLLIVLPLIWRSPYVIHIVTLILLWSFVATAWALMARFGIVSLGHGVFLGIGAYIPALLFNFHAVSPWIGMLLAIAAAVAVAMILGYPCFRFGLIGDYFALVTLAVAEVGSLVIVSYREFTGGSLGLTLNSSDRSWIDFQFDDKRVYYYISMIFLLLALYIWHRIGKSKLRLALTAIGESETAAASLGVNVIKYKMLVTMLSAGLTAMGGVLYTQYVTYISPDTVSGIGVSLSVCFKAILGGMFDILGPFIGTTIMVSLEEYVRISLGSKFTGVSEIIFGLVLLIMIIFMPRGIFGSLKEVLTRRRDVGRA